MTFIKDRFPLVIVFVVLLSLFAITVWQNNGLHTPRAKSSVVKVEHRLAKKQVVEKAPESLHVQDHKAQIQMARAAWVGLALGVLGTALIGLTLKYTHDASKLTRDALEVTKDTSYKELRAYLGLTLNVVPIEDLSQS